jgi:hypothetical protein
MTGASKGFSHALGSERESNDFRSKTDYSRNVGMASEISRSAGDRWSPSQSAISGSNPENQAKPAVNECIGTLATTGKRLPGI